LLDRKLTPQEEIHFVANSIAAWLPDHPDATVAALVPRNRRGFELVDELRRRKLDFSDTLLRSTTATRGAAGALGNVISYLSEPGSAKKLATAYQVWRRTEWKDEDFKLRYEQVKRLLNGCREVEDYLWPRAGRDWLQGLDLAIKDEWLSNELDQFRRIVHRWQGAALLPVDQLILSLAQDLFVDPPDLAISHKLGILVRQARDMHDDWRLPEFTEELAVIARNERRFLGFSEDDTGFDPQKHKGEIVVSTMHKAKGLEWDRVYLMSVNNYDFPSGQPYDNYISEPWFLRDHLNLEAEALAQLKVGLSPDDYSWYQEGIASQRARLDYVSERLRLLYVGITRAKKELYITRNTGRKGDLLPAESFLALIGLWEEHLSSPGGE
jgi:DNA helicase-2/ATP-dependent DNA helicase PcrA